MTGLFDMQDAPAWMSDPLLQADPRTYLPSALPAQSVPALPQDEQRRMALEGLLGFVPIAGELLAARDAYAAGSDAWQSLKEGDYAGALGSAGWAGLAALGTLPLLGYGYMALRPALRGALLNNRLAQKMSPLGTMPDKNQYLIERYRTLGKIDNYENFTRELYNTLAPLDDAAKTGVYDFLTTPNAQVQRFIADPDLQRKMVAVKDLIRRIGLRLVQKGMLPAESYANYVDQYLPRLYIKHVLEEHNRVFYGGSAAIRPSDRGYLKMRQTLPQEVRVAMGEIVDPAYLASRAIAVPMRDLAIMDFFEKIGQSTDWTIPRGLVTWPPHGAMPNVPRMQVTPQWLKSEATRIRDQIKYYDPATSNQALAIANQMEQLADQGLQALNQVPETVLRDFRQLPDISRFGALRGMWVRKEIYDDILGSMSFLRGAQSLAERVLGQHGLVGQATQLWKFGKVALNLPSHVRNFISNAILLNLSGVPLHRVPARLAEAARAMRDPNNRYWQIARQYGVGKTTFAANEMFRIEDEFIRGMQGQGGLSWLVGMAAKGGRFASDVYQAQEAMFKTAKIIDEMKAGTSPELAALSAHAALFDYSLVPASVRYLRNMPLGTPFITFTYKALPRLLETAIQAPWRFIPYIALREALIHQTINTNDLTRDEWEHLKKAMPMWMQEKGNAWILPTRTDNGAWQALDVSYLFPWGIYTSALNEVPAAVEHERRLGGGAVDQGLAALKGLNESLQAVGFFGAPLPQMIAGWQSGIDPFTQQPIYNPADPPAQQAKDALKWLWNLATPSWVNTRGAATQIYQSLFDPDAKDYAGRPTPTPAQALARLFGFNIFQIDPALERDRNVRLMARDAYELRDRWMMVEKDQSLSADEKRQKQKDLLDRYQALERAAAQYLRESSLTPRLTVKPKE